jgi:hypothetical protein
MSDFQLQNKPIPTRKKGKAPYRPKGSGPLSFIDVRFRNGFEAGATFQAVAGVVRCVSAPPCLIWMLNKNAVSAEKELTGRGLKFKWS